MPVCRWIYSRPDKSTFDESGRWSLDYIYEKMREENLLEVFFWDGVPAKQAFTSWEYSLYHMLFAAYDDDNNLLAFTRLANFTGLSAQQHFCYFEAGLHKAQAVAFDLFEFLKESGLKSLVGLTPKPYRHARAFAESVGYKTLGVLAGACKMARYNKHVDGVISVKTL